MHKAEPSLPPPKASFFPGMAVSVNVVEVPTNWSLITSCRFPAVEAMMLAMYNYYVCVAIEANRIVVTVKFTNGKLELTVAMAKRVTLILPHRRANTRQETAPPNVREPPKKEPVAEI